MFLKRLNNSAEVDEWRSMWNYEVLPYLRDLHLIAGAGIRINYLPEGCVIRVANRDGGGITSVSDEDGSYNGYFKITLSPPVSGAAVVTIADGATGSNSMAVVNGGSTYSLPPYSETVSGGALYLLKYTPAQYNSGGAVVSSATMAISSIHQSGGSFPTLPDGGTSGAYYCQLGRVIWSSGSAVPKVVQDHTAGVVQFNWFANCYLG